MKYYILLFAFLFCFSRLITNAQPQSDYISAAISSYIRDVGNHALIYQGKEQLKYPLNYRNHPYWLQSDYTPAQLWYMGIYYPDVLLRYDIHRQEMIALSNNPAFNVVLDTQKIDSVRIHNDKIIWIAECEKRKIKSGFYIVHFEGKLRLLELNQAVLKNYVEDRQLHTRFEFSSQLFIETDGAFTRITNKRSLTRLFSDKALEINQIAREYKLNFRAGISASVKTILTRISE